MQRYTKIKPKKPGKWTKEEDAKLNAAVEKFGKKWKLIENMKCIPERTGPQCRYVEVLNAAGTRWTTEEDNKLYAMVSIATGSDALEWNDIASQFPGRTKRQCKRRAKSLLKAKKLLTADQV
ncbi:myb-like protein L isoform X3 [Zophobas morio]|uniref:myb-like protein L isoform X3 n=1 Tax=Zophobas morio TaxID=2755281 RepID=UPI003082F6E8